MSDAQTPAIRQEQLPSAQDSMAILARAVESNTDPASIKTIAELVWRQEERNAAREFADALREFRKVCPSISKTKVARDNTMRELYRYAPLDRIAKVVDPILDSLGLSYSWDSSTDGIQMTTTCILRHVNGHRETASFTCPANEGTKIMSGAQKAASAWSFARRQTLTAVLGLTTADEDTDGNDPTTITDEEAAQIEDLLSATEANREKFLEWAGVGDVSEIRASEFDRVLAMLKRKAAR